MLLNGDGSAEGYSADPVPRFTRFRIGFRRWRRTRPFWGGLFLLLSGLEFYVSAHMDLMPVKVSFGSEGFLSWLIPLSVLLCGVLTWLSPAQRFFYGIVGAAIAVTGLIALNLGGFFVGMLFGIAGGALAVAWVPVRPDGPPPPGADDTAEIEPVGGRHSAEDTEGAEEAEEATVDGRPAVPEHEDPPSSRLTALILLVGAVTAALLALPQPTPAAAAPCPRPSGSTAPKPPTPSTSPTASPSPSPSPSDTGNPVSDFFDGLGRLLGISKSKPATAAPAPAVAAPAPAPGPTKPGPVTKPAPLPSCSTTPGKVPVPGTARVLAVPAGQPPVNKTPSTQIAALLSEIGVTFDGVVDLPTHDGTIRALQFTLASATSTPFELRVPTAAGTLSLTSSKLTVSGNVHFYASRIRGKALGLLPVDYTPDSPPLLVPPVIFFTDATVDLVFVQADVLTAPNLHIGYR